MTTPNNANFQATKDAIAESIRKDGFPTDILALVRSKTSSSEAYLAWTQENLLQKAKSPPAKLPAADALAKIQSIATSLTDLKAITTLSDAINNKATPIPLFQSPTQKYVVVITAGALSLSTPPPLVHSEADNRTKIHPYFYSLAHASSTSMPKFVYPIGQLFYKLSSETELTETNYAVVVDVAGQDHGLWLVWNRRAFSFEADDVVVTDPAKEKALFVGVDADKSLDAVQITSKTVNWKLGSDGASVVSLADFEGNARRTKVEGEVVAGAAKVEELGRVLPGAGVIDWGSGGPRPAA
ncbi:hypothetical protein QBC40DRAFT_315730 [Triangularia verruculosa]|uniref:Uncharacterized protein n=1 Tax=Triangularia verruculosa TaxID=2587418 RepID=A0AAN6X9Q3_9PEZI|nr:hypothetical protein QBC40DRAFT_315730 [Triangularia verruculosa]